MTTLSQINVLAKKSRSEYHSPKDDLPQLHVTIINDYSGASKPVA